MRDSVENLHILMLSFLKSFSSPRSKNDSQILLKDLLATYNLEVPVGLEDYLVTSVKEV